MTGPVLCTCNAATRCPLGKIGSEARCTINELRTAAGLIMDRMAEIAGAPLTAVLPPAERDWRKVEVATCLAVPFRARVRLPAHGINTLGDLAAVGLGAISSYPGLGQGTISELRHLFEQIAEGKEPNFLFPQRHAR